MYSNGKQPLFPGSTGEPVGGKTVGVVWNSRSGRSAVVKENGRDRRVKGMKKKQEVRRLLRILWLDGWMN